MFHLTPQHIETLRRVVRKLENIRGPGVRHTRDGIIIGEPPRKAPPSAVRRGRAAAVRAVRLTAVRAGEGGRYDARLYKNGTVNDEATGHLAEADLGDVPEDEDCIVWNLAEIGSTGHALNPEQEAARNHVGLVIGSNDGKRIVAISAGAGAAIPLGSEQYQVYQMTTGATAGWDWVRAHG